MIHKGVYSSLLVFALAAVLLVLAGGRHDEQVKQETLDSIVPTTIQSLGSIAGCRVFRFKEPDRARWKYLTVCVDGNGGRNATITIEGY